MARKKTKTPVEHAFGPAYGQWLNLLENYEDFFAGRISSKRVKPFTYNEEVFTLIGESMSFEEGAQKYEANEELLRIWGVNAASLRSSFKFKLRQDEWFKTFADDKLTAELITYLPFKNVYIQFEIDENRAVMALCQRRTLEEDYPELGLLKGETFICLTPSSFNKNGFKGEPHERLGVYPIEVHIRENVEWSTKIPGDSEVLEWSSEVQSEEAYPPFISALPKGIVADEWDRRGHSMQYVTALFAVLLMLSVGGVKQTNRGTVKPENVIRRKPNHKKQHPMYEYRVLELGVGDEEPIVNVQIPREYAKRRLHAVRGFWRHYKKPLKSGPNQGKTQVFVTEHWRGDKELGVVRKDYTFVNKEKEVNIDF